MANTLRFKRGLVSGIPTALAGEPLFTTDTFDLYIGNGTTNTRFQKYIASGATTQILRGDGSLYTFPLNISSPSNGQVLKYDGTNWVNSSDAGVTGSGIAGQVTYWGSASTITGSNNLFWDATNIRLGVKTNTPTYSLSVAGGISLTNDAGIGILWQNAAAFRSSGTIYMDYGQGGSGDFQFRGGSSLVNVAILYNNGYINLAANGQRVGINQASPIVPLDVNGAMAVGGVLGSHQSDRLILEYNANKSAFRAYGNTAGSGLIAFNTGGGGGSADTERMRIFAGGNVAIGSTSDNGLRFQVTGDGFFSGNINLPNSGEHYIQNLASTTFIGLNFDIPRIRFAVNNTVRMTLDASGNLGLGVIPSAWESTARAFQFGNSGTIFNNTSDYRVVIGSNFFNNSGGTATYLVSSFSTQYMQISGTHRWYNAPSGTAGNAITFTQAMTLDASGNLGIGVINPAVRLEVAGTGTQQVRVTSTSGADMRINADTVGRVGTYSNSNLAIVTNGVAIGTFFTTGNLSLNSVVDAGYKLDVNGTMRVSGASTMNATTTIQATGNAYANGNLILKNSTGASSVYLTNANGIFYLSTNGTNDHFQINSTGAATFSSSVTAASFIPTDTTAPTNGLYLAASNTLGFATASGEKMRLNASGNLGLGTISPTDSASFGRALDVSGTNGAALYLRYSTDPTIQYGYVGYDRTGLGLVLATNNALPINFSTNSVSRLTIASTGAATFSSTAQAAGFITSGGTGYAVINSASNTVTALRPTGGGASIMSTNSNGLHIAVGTQATGDLILASNNTERIRLSSNGFFSQLNATNPSASITDSYIQYSADVVAGNAAPHFRTENGAVIKLYQETTAVGNSIISLGGGNAVLDDTTFDGYTLRQIVKALRNQGILA